MKHYNIPLYSARTWQRSFVTEMVINCYNIKCGGCGPNGFQLAQNSGLSSLSLSLVGDHCVLFLDNTIFSHSTSLHPCMDADPVHVFFKWGWLVP